jgi:uncharacterized GH25 family protein
MQFVPIQRKDGQPCRLIRRKSVRSAFWAIGAAAVSLPASAHDFWLQPAPFWTSPGVIVPMVMLVGHGGARQRASIALDRFNLFRAAGPTGVTDRKGELTLNQKVADASLGFAKPGTYVVYFSTTNVPSELPAMRFNDYAAAEGLTLVTRQRVALGKTGAPGREFYSRRGKALLQVGLPGNLAQSHVTAPVGLSLEIVPLINPYRPGPAASLPVQIVYQGRPLAGALVKLNNLDADDRPVEVRRSDANGRAEFQLKRNGRWQLNVVWSQPLTNNRSADFLTTFSSLTFGFNRPATGVANRAP